MSDRINNPNLEYYRYIYHFSKRWNGKSSLKDKTVIIYCEQGFGDIIMFIRFVPHLIKLDCHVIFHAPIELHRLLLHCFPSAECFDKNNPNLPKHDYNILLLDLPFLLNCSIDTKSYIKIEEKIDMNFDCLKIGIAWEGSTQNPNNDTRCRYLKEFKCLQTPKTKLFSLHHEISQYKWTEDAEDMELYSTEINNFYDLAKLINSVDFIVAVDTASLHLAGAMGKLTFGLLSENPDPRWKEKWYDTILFTDLSYAQLYSSILIESSKKIGEYFEREFGCCLAGLHKFT